MKIEWNKVTWYSKLVAVILLLVVIALSVYFGMQFQKTKDLTMYSQLMPQTHNASSMSHMRMHKPTSTY